VLHRDRKTDDSQCEKCREQEVHYRELESRQNNPDDVHDQRYGTARWFGFADLATKRCDHTACESETHESERDAYDRQAQQDAAQNVADEY